MIIRAGEVCCAAFETVQLKMNTLNCFLDPKSVHRKYTGTQTNSSVSFEPFHNGKGNQYISFPKISFPPIWLQCRRWDGGNYVLVTVNDYFVYASENRPPRFLNLFCVTSAPQTDQYLSDKALSPDCGQSIFWHAQY